VSIDATQISATKRAWGLAEPALGLSLGAAHTRQQSDRQRGWVNLAESLKLHSVWLPEMHFAAGACSAPLVGLAEFAAMTKRLRLGTTSLLLPLHPPEQIAAEIAALDQLSGGRLLIGLGRGFNRKMLDAFDVPPAEKRDRFDAALDQILARWAEGNRNHSALATHQRPHPPLAVAAFGAKGLAQAARRGLPYLASPVETFDQIVENQAQHRAQLSSGQPRPLSLIMRTIFVSQDETELAAVRQGLDQEIRGRREHLPAAVRTALEAPLGERAIIGTRAEVIESLKSMHLRIGFDLLIVRPQIMKMADQALERSLQCLAKEVWPAVIGDSAIGV
jgi:alkanesulfonate monooxygenase SsuD/methylene tetrahydromethanopterin reductase-like flavin-dependent oxidoreductase (luciferase family)